MSSTENSDPQVNAELAEVDQYEEADQTETQQNEEVAEETSTTTESEAVLDINDEQLKAWEEEAQEFATQAETVPTTEATTSSTMEADSRSIYVGNVDYSISEDELSQFFAACGKVLRVTIPKDYYGQPKGFGYVEFENVDGAVKAVYLNETELKGRALKISSKRTNVPHFKGAGGRGGRGGRGGHRGRGRGGFMPPMMFNPYAFSNMYMAPMTRGRGGARGGRGRHNPM